MHDCVEFKNLKGLVKSEITEVMIVIAKIIRLLLLVTMIFTLVSCGGRNEPITLQDEGDTETSSVQQQGVQQEQKQLSLSIGDTEVSVEWEDSKSIEALKDMVSAEPLKVSLSMYGGFEQVGELERELPSDDKQMETKAGDIVLYSGNQIVLFYGSNSWAYTRLGHITDKTAEELEELLGNGDVSITLEVK